MMAILKGQTDYLAFLAGLTFLFLLLICLSISRDRQSRAAFFWLGCFALSQWIWHWSVLLHPLWGGCIPDRDGTVLFILVAQGALGAAGISVLSAARGGRLAKGALFFCLALALAASWAEYLNVSGFMAVLTGLGSGLLAGWGLLRDGRRLHSLPLLSAALPLALYGATLILVVPPARFGWEEEFLAGTFPAILRTHLTLLQVILSVGITLPMWLHAQHREFRPDQDRIPGWPGQAWYLVLALSLLLGLGGFSTALLGQNLEAEMREDLALQARLLAAALPWESVGRLTGTEADLEAADYAQIKRLLMAMRAANPDCRFTYLLGVRDRGVIFLADSEPTTSPDYSPPGQMYEEASEKLKSLAAAPEAFLEGPETDRWGTWMSALEVIRHGANGEFLAFVGLDIDVRDWQSKIALHRLLPISITLLMIILLSGVFLSEQKLLSSAQHVAISEERYRSLVEGTPNGVCLFDLEGHFMAVNRNGLAMLGAQEMAEVDKPFQDYWSREYQSRLAEAFAQVRAGRLAVLEGEILITPGSPRVWQVVLNPIKGKQDVPTGCVGILNDITEQKQAQEALFTSRALLQSLLDSIPDLLMVLDRDFRVVYYNNQGRRAVEASGNSNSPVCYRCFRSRTAPCQDCPVKEVFATGTTVELEQVNPADGTCYEVRAFPIFGSDGQVTMVIEHLRDITERKRVEEALRTRQAKLDGIFRAAPVGIGLVVNRLIKEVNDQVCLMTGYSKEDLLGKSSRMLYPSQEEYEQVGREKYRQIRQQGCGTVETQWLHRNGSVIDVLLSSAPLYPGDLSREVLFTAMNITERKKLEAVRAKIDKMESLGIMAGGIAHDFNNVLMAILGNISLMGLALTPEEIRERLNDAEQGCRQAMLLAKQLLTFAKGGAPVMKPHDVRLLLEEAARLALSGSKAKRVMTFPPGLWDVNVDDSQMYQVFTNLLINADQAMPAGGQIHIRAENRTVGESDFPTLMPGNYVLITIVDQGVGIAPEYLDKIFDPYFSTKQKGSGLGLATVYSIVKQHGGFIACDSQLGQGVTFSLYLPALEPRQHLEPVTDKKIFLGQGHILVLEDDVSVRSVMEKMLAKLGYEAVFAGEGQEVLNLYAQARQAGETFDLVILDLTIPGGMGGLETFQKLQELDADVRAIVSSGYADNPVLANYRELGFAGVITKPYRISELSGVLHTVMGSVHCPIVEPTGDGELVVKG